MVYSAALLLILGMACCCSALRTQAADLPSLFSDVTSASRYVYDLKDDQGSQMACIHVYEAQDRNAWGGAPYFSVYHAMVGTEFEVRLATSHNLTSWQFRRTLLQNADMPYITRPSGVQTTWLLLTHEQWMNKGSQLPSRLGFKLYYNESSLAEGSHFVRLPTTGTLHPNLSHAAPRTQRAPRAYTCPVPHVSYRRLVTQTRSLTRFALTLALPWEPLNRTPTPPRSRWVSTRSSRAPRPSTAHRR